MLETWKDGPYIFILAIESPKPFEVDGIYKIFRPIKINERMIIEALNEVLQSLLFV